VLLRLAWLVADVGAALEGHPASVGRKELDTVWQRLAGDLGVSPRPFTAAATELVAREPTDRVLRLGTVFGLSSLDLALLVVAAAPEVDHRFSLLFGGLDGVQQPSRPSVGLALSLCGAGVGDPRARSRLGPAGPLRRHYLLDLAGAEQPFPARRLVVPDRLVGHLVGDDAVDQAVGVLCGQVPGLADPAADAVARVLRAGATIVHVHSTAGQAGASLAVGAAQQLGGSPLVVDLGRLPLDPERTELAPVVVAAVREAGISDRVLVLVDPAGGVVRDASAVAALEQAVRPVLVVDAEHWEPRLLGGVVHHVEAAETDPAARAQLWASELDGLVPADSPTQLRLRALRLTPEQIAGSARTMRLLAAADGAAPGAEVATEIAYRHSAVRLRSTAVLTVPRATLDDVILPEVARAGLETLLAWARQRERLLREAGALAGKGTKGRGLVAMFVGGPGTGKTLAAEALATELGLVLCTVDLSGLIDKYIGETEKNLERVITEAEHLNVLLFFDEADALFGARSGVSDARDRYANQEVAYLLQRIERFEGLAVLATNLVANVDQAFLRRVHHVVTFDNPDEQIRRRLWESHLAAVPALDSSDPPDVRWLAEALDVPGGTIRNIVLGAAFRAAEANRPVTMADLVVAAHDEYRKLGRLPVER
jgi:AAA+ superfamily predicted ATPase